MVCGVLIAMVLVAVIIVILAVTIRWVENVFTIYIVLLFVSLKSALVWRCIANIYREQGFSIIVLRGNIQVAAPDETRTGDP